MSDEKDENTKLPPLSESQMLAAVQIPAVYSNRFSISINQEIVRITFLEQATADAERSVPRSSVAISAATAQTLGEMILNLLPQRPKA